MPEISLTTAEYSSATFQELGNFLFVSTGKPQRKGKLLLCLFDLTTKLTITASVASTIGDHFRAQNMW
jgi:hypothetical protein